MVGLRCRPTMAAFDLHHGGPRSLRDLVPPYGYPTAPVELMRAVVVCNHRACERRPTMAEEEILETWPGPWENRRISLAITPSEERNMSRIALGRLLLAGFLVACVALGQAATDESKPTNKRARKGGKKPDAVQKEPGDPASSSAKTPPEAKKPDGKTASDQKKDDEKKSADEKKPAAEKEAAAKPATHKVKKGPFRVEVDLDGIFEAQNQSELFVRPQEWAGLSVLKAVEHGAAVKQGDLVLVFDTEKIDRAIVDLRTEVQLDELALKQAEAQLAAQEKPLLWKNRQTIAAAATPSKTGSNSRKSISRCWPK